jgi:hypothetical protein
VKLPLVLEDIIPLRRAGVAVGVASWILRAGEQLTGVGW